MYPKHLVLGLVRPAAFMVVISFFLSCLLLPHASGEDGTEAQDGCGQGPALSSHKMTRSEMEAFRAVFGERDLAVDYNVIIDGRGTGKAPPTDEAYAMLPGNISVLDAVEPTEHPTSFDLSTSPSFPPVGDQGRQGSCTAWATTYYAYGYIEAVDQGWMQTKAGNTSQLLSPAWTYNKVNGGVDRGSWEWDNMMVLRDWGTSTMALLPYDDSDYTDWGSPAAFREAPMHRILEPFMIPYNGAVTVETVKTLITAGTPVTFGIDANDYFKGFMDGNYILSAAEYNSKRPNHANTFIGFDDSITDDGEIGAFRVVNSWGSAWGDGGFYWLTYEAFKEIGSRDLLDLAFVQDAEDYSPTMRAVWHLDPPPSRDAGIAVAIGVYPESAQTKRPYYWLSTDTALRFPTYMCVDVSEFRALYDAGAEDFLISVNATAVPGALEGFKIELFETAYSTSEPSQSSGEAWNDPRAVPGRIDLRFAYYDTIGLGAAVDSSAALSSGGDVKWVGVPHEWSLGQDSAQSGNIGDLEESTLATGFLGPVTIGFEWKVSSEAAGDFLRFEVDGIELAAISGDLGWESRSFDLGPGMHVAKWTYAKDDSGSDGDDCGWLDHLTLSTSAGPEPPVAYFDLIPATGDLTTLFEFDASGSYDIEDPDALLTIRWDWNGDGTWDTDWSGELVTYHMFDKPGEYTVRVQVRDSDGLTDDFERQVTVVELIPEFGTLAGPIVATLTALVIIAFSNRRKRSGHGGL